MKDLTEKIEERFINELLEKVIKRAVEVIERKQPWNQGDIGPATMNREQTAQYLGISVSNVDKLLSENAIPCVRPHGPGHGRRVFFRRKTLDKWMDEKEKQSIKKVNDLAEENNNDYKVKVN